MKIKTARGLARRIKTLTDRIGRDRDALRELIDTAEALEESASRAFDHLESAADALSEYA